MDSERRVLKSGSRSALVTGGAGFIGQHLRRSLMADGWHVTSIDPVHEQETRSAEVGLSVEFSGTVQDVLAHRSLPSFDVIFHLGASVGVRRVIERPLESLVNNTEATATVLEFAGSNGGKVILLSSSEVYGRDAKEVEEAHARTVGTAHSKRWSYATGKAYDETMAMLYHRARNIPVVIARPFNVVGPGQGTESDMVLPRFVRRALRREPLFVHGDGRQFRTFTYVGDVVTALARLATAREAVGEVFNVAGTKPTTILELAQIVVEESRSDSPIKTIPYDPEIEDVRIRTACSDKLAKYTGLRCTTPLRSIVREVIASERERIHGIAVR